MLIEHFPKCGSELRYLSYAFNPPIHAKVCSNPECDFKYEEPRESIEHVVFTPETNGGQGLTWVDNSISPIEPKFTVEELEIAEKGLATISNLPLDLLTFNDDVYAALDTAKRAIAVVKEQVIRDGRK